MNSAVIVAAGKGLRVGKKIPKQFLKINGNEILYYSVKTFLNHPQINEVVIVVNTDWINLVANNYKNCKVVKGGNSRSDSSLNGLLATDNSSNNVLIHDAARPFVSQKIISACLAVLNKYEGSAPVRRSNNSLVHLDNKKTSYVDRSKIYEVQTPQCFNREFILEVLSSKSEGTDEIGMVLNKYPNAKLKFINGDSNNNKITSEMDLKLFEMLSN